MTDTNDDELRVRFDVLRDHDRGVTPEFRQLLEAAPGRSRSAGRGRVRSERWLAAAASIVIAALLAAQLLNRGARARVPDATAISTWQSPTAGLLEMPVKELLAPPPLLSSVFDGVATMSVQSKTD